MNFLTQLRALTELINNSSSPAIEVANRPQIYHWPHAPVPLTVWSLWNNTIKQDRQSISPNKSSGGHKLTIIITRSPWTVHHTTSGISRDRETPLDNCGIYYRKYILGRVDIEFPRDPRAGYHFCCPSEVVGVYVDRPVAVVHWNWLEWEHNIGRPNSAILLLHSFVIDIIISQT